MKVKDLKEYLDTLDEDAPIAYWLWQEKNVVAEINRLKNWSRQGANTEYEAKLNQLTDGDIAYILDSINEYFDDDVVYHAVSHALDRSGKLLLHELDVDGLIMEKVEEETS